MNNIFVFGTLKKGFYNHTRFNFDKNTKFIKDVELAGYKMHDLGQYPCIKKTGAPGDIIHGEIYTYLDKDTQGIISRMESSAGYAPETVTIDGIEAVVYIYMGKRTSPVIKSGKWEKKI